MSRFLIFGAKGQVGRALAAVLGPELALSITREQVDLAEPSTLEASLDRLVGTDLPYAVINAAAYTSVDQAENDEALAFRVNADAPGVLATWCAKRDVPFVHFSTDYVFPGTGIKPFSEEDPTGPLNTYGKSKLAGDLAVVRAFAQLDQQRYLIFRTSWVYDSVGKNFFRTMLKLGSEREELKVVADQIGAPTYAPHLAQGALSALAKASEAGRFPGGIYHLCGAGETSWHGFAQAIFAQAKTARLPLKLHGVLQITTEEFATPAARPKNSRLSCEKSKWVLGTQLPSWEDGLKECFKALLSEKSAKSEASAEQTVSDTKKVIR